jgi:hypothetical protein
MSGWTEGRAGEGSGVLVVPRFSLPGALQAHLGHQSLYCAPGHGDVVPVQLLPHRAGPWTE